MSEPTIDLPTFHDLQETAGADFVAELVAAFAEDAPRMASDLAAALAAADVDAFRRAAHSLKSNGQTFGAVDLAARARELELTAADVVARGDATIVAELATEVERVVTELTELARG